jgi:hypothetical protein
VYECRVRRSVLDGYEYVSGWPLSQGSNEREGGSLVKCLGQGLFAGVLRSNSASERGGSMVKVSAGTGVGLPRSNSAGDGGGDGDHREMRAECKTTAGAWATPGRFLPAECKTTAGGLGNPLVASCPGGPSHAAVRPRTRKMKNLAGASSEVPGGGEAVEGHRSLSYENSNRQVRRKGSRVDTGRSRLV